MRTVFFNRRGETPAQRRQQACYLAQHMAPMIRALMLATVAIYILATLTRSLIEQAPAALLTLRLLPVLPLVLVAVVARRTQRPLSLSLLSLSSVLLLQIGINLNGLAPPAAQLWIMPGILVPVASSVMWLGRWDFFIAMLLCALGPLPALVLRDVAALQIVQYSVYMLIAISLAAVLRSFTVRILLEQYRLEEKLRRQAHTDGLTGLLLRNRFLELARPALMDAYQQRQPVCLLYLDADHFKRLNDNHGHAAGDDALVALGAALRAHTRPTDLIGRIGGEEFALLLPGFDLQRACLRAEQLRLAVRAIHRPDGPLTVSIGIAESTGDNEGIESLLARADEAMREAKRDGRDRVARA